VALDHPADTYTPSRRVVEITLKQIRPTLGEAFLTGQHFAGRQARAIGRRALDPLRIRRYLQAQVVRKLQIGAGPNPLRGWLNTDLLPDTYPEHRNEIVFLDATRPFPFLDLTFDYVFSEHQIEHIPEPAAHSMIKECFRVLRPGGRLRIATPDLAAILDLYEEPLNKTEQHYVEWVMTTFRPNIGSGNKRCYVINHMFTDHKHEFIYDFETLSAIFAEAGFAEILQRKPGESDDPVLRGVELHGQAIGDEEVNRFETMVIEAVRPSPPDERRA
jgi:predicted SAM-dependent methyltransferase